MFKDFYPKVFPAIRVHVWGGFGSQLFALIIADRLLTRTRLRRISIVFHSSGVTERKLEIPRVWLDNFRIVQVADYQKQSSRNIDTNRKTMFFALREKLKDFLSWSGLAATSNSEEEFLKLRPWVLSIRGHYTRIHLKESEIRELMLKFELSMDMPTMNAIAIHYRLGDLMTLENKGIISPYRIVNTWKNCMKTELPLQIFSDGIRQDFERVWKEAEGPQGVEFNNLSPIQTIQSCFKVEEFLGTNTKLSLWIAIFRSELSSKQTFIPTEIQHQLDTLLKLQNSGKSIHGY